MRRVFFYISYTKLAAVLSFSTIAKDQIYVVISANPTPNDTPKVQPICAANMCNDLSKSTNIILYFIISFLINIWKKIIVLVLEWIAVFCICLYKEAEHVLHSLSSSVISGKIFHLDCYKQEI